DLGAAEILAEIGVNLSGERRFEEAADAFEQAEARAARANARLLLTKIGNYRAIDALNRGERGKARELALAANAARDQLFATGGGGANRLTADETREIEDAASVRAGRGLLMAMGELSDREKAAVLSAQAEYLAGVASRGMNRPAEASAHLDAATRRLGTSPVRPGWLVALIYNERSRLEAASGDAGGAMREAQTGLALLRKDAPGTRAEGHLLLTLAEAKRLGGDVQGALADSRAAVALFSAHRESPGMPADVAAAHLGALQQAWTGANDPAVADEYFQTLTMVWDGAAARSAAQLAARLAVSEGGDAVRDYQDAQRGYRAALARRERLSTNTEADRSLIDQADAEASAAAAKLASAEEKLRSQSPRYVELLSPKLNSAELSASLEEGEGYLRLVVADERVFGALVTREGVRPYAVDLTEREAKDLADKVRKSVLLRRGRLPDYDMAAAQTLYAKLFAPIEGAMEGLTRLQIDAGGPLAGVPFAGLVAKAPDEATLKRIRDDQDYRGVEWFGRKKAIAAALGPAAFVRIRANPNPVSATAAMTFGDFQPNPALVAERIASRRGLSDRCRKELEAVLMRLEALPETLQEAQQTAAAFGAGGRAVTQASFTDEAVLNDPAVADAGVLVLATHGVLGLSNCFAEPALLASTGPEGDGLIEASELLDVKLKARLVVMSACDTAGGGRSDAARSGFADGGEALSGLARAFIYAGASSVLATHWKIDASTSSLQTQALLTSAVQSGKPLSVALADAQKVLYDNAETAHPFYWSGFVLIGDGATRLGVGEQQAAAAPTSAD
ncbi:MAG TPA: CHAT domain-containing protein, partial [Caulobacteraceae bacterium]|nr:CHAT domain-containing protein [Caulobacteraceae bacterium]